MEFDKLISVSGQGSLFKIISRTNFGLIAESLEDKKRIPVYQSTNVSTLTDISIYTEEGEISLKEVFIKLHEKEAGKETAILKSKDPEIKKYFEEILPDFDKEKVYTSDIKKVFKWYNQLIKSNLLDPEELKKKDEEVEEEAEEKAETKTKAKSKKEEGAETEKKPAAKKEKSETTKKKTPTAKTNKPAPKVTNAPAKKVQTVRKAGG